MLSGRESEDKLADRCQYDWRGFMLLLQKIPIVLSIAAQIISAVKYYSACNKEKPPPNPRAFAHN